ncbi:unnamed protein product, partial [Ilex paraguariensis]
MTSSLCFLVPKRPKVPSLQPMPHREPLESPGGRSPMPSPPSASPVALPGVARVAPGVVLEPAPKSPPFQ